jgi:hypothetical protein
MFVVQSQFLHPFESTLGNLQSLMHGALCMHMWAKNMSIPCSTGALICTQVVCFAGRGAEFGEGGDGSFPWTLLLWTRFIVHSMQSV